MEYVCHVSDHVFGPVHKMPVWVSHTLFIITSINIDVLSELEESLFSGGIWDIINMEGIIKCL